MSRCGADMDVEGGDVGRIGGISEKAEEAFMIGQMCQRRELQLGQRDMMRD